MFQIIYKWLNITTCEFHQETSWRLHKWLLVSGSRTYPGSRGPFSKYLIWNKPCLRFDKAPELFFSLGASLTRLRREPSVKPLKENVKWPELRQETSQAKNVKIRAQFTQFLLPAIITFYRELHTLLTLVMGYLHQGVISLKLPEEFVS